MAHDRSNDQYVSFNIEKVIDDEYVVALFIIRQADKRPLIEIAKEIERARTAEPHELECYQRIMKFNKYVPLIKERDGYTKEEITKYVNALKERTRMRNPKEWETYRRRLLF